MAAVEVSTDGGRTWQPAELDRQPSPWAWARWYHLGGRPPGRTSCARGPPAAGNTQPLEIPWNTGGYANNAVQRVDVTVRDGADAAAGPA